MGHFGPEGKQVQYVHPHVWQREAAGDGERIVAAPKDQFVDLMLKLSACLEPPFSVLYILAIPRKCMPGRYQLEQSLSYKELVSMLAPFTEYLEGDARHHLWIYSFTSAVTLVYDQHNLIYAYGPLEKYIQTLGEAGLTEGKVEIPFPHMHNYFREFDSEEERFIESFTWKRTDLLPGVDD